MTGFRSRREFIKGAATLALMPVIAQSNIPYSPLKVGIIGLDTSHAIAFTKLLKDYDDVEVTHAYPKGSEKIESSASRIPGYTTEMKQLGVEIVADLEDLVQACDAFMLETNDGTLRLEQAKILFEGGKPVFIDKPVAAQYDEVVQIYNLAKEKNIPIFSSSGLRYTEKMMEITSENPQVLSAHTFSPAFTEPSHSDLFWYGIHGVEMLYTLMGTGCSSVKTIHSDDFTTVIGIWEDGRQGVFRGTRAGAHSYGGTVFTEEKTYETGSFDNYQGLVGKVVDFFITNTPDVSHEETLEIYAFMEAAKLSRIKGGEEIFLNEL